MTVKHTPGAMKKFRRTPWRFQQTVECPSGLAAQQEFAAAVISAHGHITEATVTIHNVVFGTERMKALCPADARLATDWSLLANAQEAVSLLGAALNDGPDFIFVPEPKPFVCYSDHDEWITFYSNTKSNLNHIIELLAARGYELVQDWQREF